MLVPQSTASRESRGASPFIYTKPAMLANVAHDMTRGKALPCLSQKGTFLLDKCSRATQILILACRLRLDVILNEI